MLVRWTPLVALVLLAPTALATPPSPPLDLSLRIDGNPTLQERFTITLDISAHVTLDNVTVGLVLPPDWEKDPPRNLTLDLRQGDERSVTWTVTPKSEGFWIARGNLAAYEGGMTSWAQHFGFLHGNISRASADAEDVIPMPAVDLQFRAVEQTPANVTLIATATPRASWMRFGTLSTEFGILNESRTAHAPGTRALIATLTTVVPPHHGARAWSQFTFTPDWRTDMPPDTGRHGTGLGCRDLWVNREAAPSLSIEPSRDCLETESHLATAPGLAAAALVGMAALWIQHRRRQ